MAEPLASLLTAIESLWIANRASSGGLQVFTEAQFGKKSADRQKGFPYCNINVDGSRLVIVTKQSRIDEHEIVFEIYDSTKDQAKARAGIVSDVYLAGFSQLANAGLSLAEGSLVAVRPIGSAFGGEDRSVYRWDLRIGFQTQKGR